MTELTKAHKLYLTHRPTGIPETVSVTSREALWLEQGMGMIQTNYTVSKQMDLIDYALKSILARTGTYYGEELFDIDKLVEYQPIKRPTNHMANDSTRGNRSNWEDPKGYGY